MSGFGMEKGHFIKGEALFFGLFIYHPGYIENKTYKRRKE